MGLVSHRFVQTATALLLIAAIALPAAGRVLCISNDGHIAIEAPHPSDGCGDTQTPIGHGEVPSSTVATERGCTDIGLASPVFVRPEQQRDCLGDLRSGPTQLLFLVDWPEATPLRPDALDLDHHIDLHSQRLLTIRSTILLL